MAEGQQQGDRPGEPVCVVLLGDSVFDNWPYVVSKHHPPVDKQLERACSKRGWQTSMLAVDGAVIEDVLEAQVPRIPESATHIVLSVSGNDCLGLLSLVVQHCFNPVTVGWAMTRGLAQVSRDFEVLVEGLLASGKKLMVCTVYRPQFSNFMMGSLVRIGLARMNSRIRRCAKRRGVSVLHNFALFDSREDFANPIEPSVRGGAKLVRNIVQWVQDTMENDGLSRTYKDLHVDDALIFTYSPVTREEQQRAKRLSEMGSSRAELNEPWRE